MPLEVQGKYISRIRPHQLNNCEFAVGSCHRVGHGLLVQRRGNNLVVVNTNDGWDAVCVDGSPAQLWVTRLQPGTTLEVK